VKGRGGAAWWFVLIVGAATVVAAAYSLSRGVVPLPIGETVRALVAHFSVGSDDDTHSVIVGAVRLPEISLALLAGASLATSGSVMQALFRNPLASPEIMGTMMGAALGSLLAIVTDLSRQSVLATPLCGLAGAFGVSLVVWLIAVGPGGVSLTSLLLAGVALNSLLGALIAFWTQMLAGTGFKTPEVMFWLMGGVERKLPEHVATVAVGLVVFSALIVPFVRELDLLTLGEDEARALGVRVPLVRNLLLLASCGLTATTVACTGGITFVGLVVPHIVRLLVGARHAALLPCAAVAGAFVLVSADLACRLLARSFELRLGVVTSALGAPFFLWLLFVHRRGMRA
jgi:iron complex transport system permease protein